MSNQWAVVQRFIGIGVSQFGRLDWLLLGLALASGATWVWLAKSRISVGRPLLEPRERKRPYWTMAEFFVCFALPLLCTIAGIKVGKRWMTEQASEQIAKGNFSAASQSPHDNTILMIVTIIAIGITLLSVLVWMNLLKRKHLSDYGFWLSFDDIKLGCIAAFLVLPHVLLLSAFINVLIPYQHPVVDTLKGQLSWQLLLLQVGLTVFLAPWYEEFTYRALLQGGAEQMAWRLRLAEQAESKPVALQTILASEVASWSWWPVVMSSTVFAVQHLPHGGGAFPIFLLALVLGYLYRQTGRMGPGLVVHIILNGFSMSVFVFNLWWGK